MNLEEYYKEISKPITNEELIEWAEEKGIDDVIKNIVYYKGSSLKDERTQDICAAINYYVDMLKQHLNLNST